MPQMSPILWTTLMIFTTFMIHQTNSMMKFEQTIEKKKKKKKNFKMKW
uniref:ATP synthase F0 subunit 8 n=1 Tax=Zecheuna tonkinensis TaxID=2844956 RepID=A0A8H2SN12_9HEMI|nr:ATP synthase F0 subunit 8 [Zecheuna tonkinensis]